MSTAEPKAAEGGTGNDTELDVVELVLTGENNHVEVADFIALVTASTQVNQIPFSDPLKLVIKDLSLSLIHISEPTRPY